MPPSSFIAFHRSRGRLRSTRIGGSEGSNSVSPQQDFEKIAKRKTPGAGNRNTGLTSSEHQSHNKKFATPN
jgi:hypothetical protein